MINIGQINPIYGGAYIMISFPEINGIHIDSSNEDVVELGLSVASGTMKYEQILCWVEEHKINQ